MAENEHKRFQYSHGMLVIYFILTFTTTWAILIPGLKLVPKNLLTLIFIPAAFGPFLSVIITFLIFKGWADLRNWLRQVFKVRISIILYLAGAFFIPIGIGILHYLLYRLLGGDPSLANAPPWFLYLAYLIPTALLTGGNEEPGWRGFALPALLERFHPVTSALILGVIHSIWHLPLMSHYDTTIYWYIFNLVPLTFILNWFYLKSHYAVIPVMLFHAGTNVIGRFFPTPMDLLDGIGTYMFLRGIVYWAIAIVLLIVTKGRLGYDSKNSNE